MLRSKPLTIMSQNYSGYYMGEDMPQDVYGGYPSASVGQNSAPPGSGSVMGQAASPSHYPVFNDVSFP